MKVGDGGGTFSLIVCEQSLGINELDLLKGIEGVDKVLIGNDAFTVVFKADSIFDITAATVIKAQQAIKEALRRVSCDKIPAAVPQT